jgi:acyl carrier protein
MNTDQRPRQERDAPGDAAEMSRAVRAAIAQVAPDVDSEEIPADVDFADHAALDSMDFLAVITAVEQRTGIGVPELDYPSVTTIADFAAYLVRSESEG